MVKHGIPRDSDAPFMLYPQPGGRVRLHGTDTHISSTNLQQVSDLSVNKTRSLSQHRRWSQNTMPENGLMEFKYLSLSLGWAGFLPGTGLCSPVEWVIHACGLKDSQSTHIHTLPVSTFLFNCTSFVFFSSLKMSPSFFFFWLLPPGLGTVDLLAPFHPVSWLLDYYTNLHQLHAPLLDIYLLLSHGLWIQVPSAVNTVGGSGG